MAFQQNKLVGDYRSQFIMVTTPLTNVTEEWLKEIFTDGLEEEIQVEIQVFGVDNLALSMTVAQRIGDQTICLERIRAQ